MHRWHSLVQAALVVSQEAGGLSRFERARLASLLLAISAHQEAVLQRKVASMSQLVRSEGMAWSVQKVWNVDGLSAIATTDGWLQKLVTPSLSAACLPSLLLPQPEALMLPPPLRATDPSVTWIHRAVRVGLPRGRGRQQHGGVGAVPGRPAAGRHSR